MRLWNRLGVVLAALLLLALLPGQAAPGHAQEGVCDVAPEPRLSLGDWVIVTDLVADTGAGALRMRGTPFTSGEEVALLPAGTYGQVIDGPACNDGFWWWKLLIDDMGVEGWSAEGYGLAYYLAPVAAPVTNQQPTITPIPQDTEAPPAAATEAATEEAPPTEAVAAADESGGPVQVTAGGGFSPVARFDVVSGSALAISADGSAVALAQEERIIVFDGADLTLRNALNYEAATPTGIALSPDGATLLAGYGTGDLVWWDVAAGTVARREEGQAAITQVAFSPDGATIAAADSDGRIVLYDHQDVFAVRLMEPQAVGTETDLDVGGLAFSPDGAQLLVGALRPAGDLGRVTLHDVATLEAVSSTQGPYGSGLFASNDAVLLTGGAAIPTSLWTPSSGILTSLPGTQGWRAVTPRPDDTLLALAGISGLTLWDSETRQTAATLSVNPASMAAFDASGETMVTLVVGELVLWRTGQAIQAEEPPATEETPAEAPAADTGATTDCPGDPSISFLQTGSTAITADQAHPVRLRPTPSTESIINELVYQDVTMTVVGGPTCADDLRWWMVQVSGRTGWTVEAADGRYLLVDPNNTPADLVFAPDPALAAIPASPPETPPGAQPTPRPQTAPAVARRATYTPDGSLLVVGDGTGVRQYNPASFELITMLGTGPVIDFVTMNGTLYAVTWAADGLRLVNAASGDALSTIVNGPHDPAWAAAAPDGRWLVLGPTSDGATATLWEPATGAAPAALPFWWPGWGVVFAEFSPDDRFVMINDIVSVRSCATAGTGCLFDLIREDWVGAGLFGDVNWSGDGQQLIGFSDRFWLWDRNILGVGFTIRTTLGPQDPRQVALNTNGTRGAIVANALMELWNLETYVANTVIQLPGPANSVEFSPDGAQLLIAAGDAVLVYDPVGGDVIRQIE